MGQKVHPRGFRVGITQKHRSLWIATGKTKNSAKTYKKRLEHETILRKVFLKKVVGQEISKIEISSRVQVNATGSETILSSMNVYTPNPKAFFTDGNATKVKVVNKETFKQAHAQLRNKTPNLLNNFILEAKKKYNTILDLKIVEVENPDWDAKLIAESIGRDVENRINFRRAIQKSIQSATTQKIRDNVVSEIVGIKIQIAGRLNGAEMARTEWKRKGRVPLHTISADIDYHHHEAQTIYGILGIKVWVCKSI